MTFSNRVMVLGLMTAVVVGGMAPAAMGQGVGPGYGTLPLSFEPNRGQTASAVQWVSRGPEFTVFLTGHDAVLEMSAVTPAKKAGETAKVASAALRMNLLGAKSVERAAGEELLPGTANYFTGADKSHWQTAVPTYGKVRLSAVYPGVDLVYYGHAGRLEYDFVVSAGADADVIRLGFEGAKATLAADGDLLLPIAGKEVRLNKPVVFQMRDGKREPVAGSFEVAANGEVGFGLGAYDHARELTIDPTLIFAGTLGTGNQQTLANGMAVNAAGEMYLTGTTNDLAFPTTTGVIFPACGPVANGVTRCGASSQSSAFITKISADGKSLVWSTYLHGVSGYETGVALTLDSAGVVYATGTTISNDFPITSDAYQKLCGPAGDKYDANARQYTTVTSGCARNEPTAGNQYIYNQPDVYLVKLNPTGTGILYGTFLGGSTYDAPSGIALDAGGNIYISGTTISTQTLYPGNGSSIVFPTVGGYESGAAAGVYQEFLSKFNNSGTTLLYSTMLGSPITNGSNSVSTSVAAGQNGIAFLGGHTLASDFPTTAGALKRNCTPTPGNTPLCTYESGTIAAFDTTKTGTASLLYSTLLSGTLPQNGINTAQTIVTALLADSSNNVIATGYTLAPDFPTTAGVYQPTCVLNATCNAAFLSKLNAAGSGLIYSTFYGGTSTSGVHGATGYALAVDAKGRVYVYGASADGGCDLPNVQAIQGCQAGGKVFLATFSSDAKQLLFATRFGDVAQPTAQGPAGANGVGLDSGGNIYFAGVTQGSTFPVTSGTYNTTLTNPSFYRGFFAKLSPLQYVSATTLAVSPTNTAAGQPVTFTATVAGTQTTQVPTGTVTFMNGTATLGTGTLNSAGVATFTSSTLAVAVYSVTAVYGGDTDFLTSTSAAQALTIKTPVVPTVTLTLSTLLAPVGGNVVFTPSVTGTSGAPTGTVFFMDGTTTLGSSVLTGAGAATFSTSTLAAGTHNVSLRYSGDATYGTVTTATQALVVRAIAATTTVLSTSVANANVGQSVVLTATVTSQGVGTPTGTVTFLDGTTTLGTGTLNGSAVATLTTSALAAGSHSITAVYGGDAFFTGSTSTALVQVVTAPAITFAAVPSTLTIVRGASASTVITGTPVGGYTGTTTFTCGTLPVDVSCTFAPPTLTFSGNNLAQSTTLTVATNAPHAALTWPGKTTGGVSYAWMLPLFGMAGLAATRKKRTRMLLLAMVLSVSAAVGMSGCASSPQTTPPGTYTVPVVVTAGSGSSTLNLTIVVQ